MDEFLKMDEASRRRCYSPPFTRHKGKGEKGKDKGKGKGKSKNQKDQTVLWCRNHLKEGGCSRGKDCPIPHLSAEAVEAIKIAVTDAQKAS